jgi:hypothetical protein
MVKVSRSFPDCPGYRLDSSMGFGRERIRGRIERHPVLLDADAKPEEATD